jgi:heme-degrading monooxygenase HmoA
MYVSMSRLRIEPGRAPELIRAFNSRLHEVDSVAGFIDLQVWQSDRDAGEVVMVSRWTDRASFKDYMRSAAHQRSHERIAPDLQDAIQLERLDHMHTYEVVAE